MYDDRVFYKTTSKQILPCCALCQISASDRTPIEELEEVIANLKEEAKRENEINGSYGVGQRACFIIVTPREKKLERNVKLLGFRNVAQFDRRVGYEPIGKLKMYFLNW